MPKHAFTPICILKYSGMSIGMLAAGSDMSMKISSPRFDGLLVLLQ